MKIKPTLSNNSAKDILMQQSNEEELEKYIKRNMGLEKC